MASLNSLSITFDCTDVETQSLFWAELLHAEIDEGANEFVASIGGIHDGASPTPGMLFLKVDDRADARSAGAESSGRVVAKNPLHIDLDDPDYPADVDRAVALGATKVASFDEYGIEWTTLTDPEGYVFDIGRRKAESRKAESEELR
ncbi:MULTISPECIES: VOC family protein [Brevibacterium]|uniref:Glyoxalase-like domain-containing protein n=1 Tax=Brevibacterium casei TaxID=33889 RepID=A0A7T3ZX42_9MICO|nr:VOC family protein [Brevibacterium casei]QQB13288.1 hypothetical protein I6H47_10555 [Brevibacterium casei]